MVVYARRLNILFQFFFLILRSMSRGGMKNFAFTLRIRWRCDNIIILRVLDDDDDGDADGRMGKGCVLSIWDQKITSIEKKSFFEELPFLSLLSGMIVFDGFRVVCMTCWQIVCLYIFFCLGLGCLLICVCD